MNWSRVKTAFIILLMVCNLVLFFVYNEFLFTEKKVKEDVLIDRLNVLFENEKIDIKDLKFSRVDKVPTLKISETDVDFNKEKECFEKLGLKSYDVKNNSGYLFALTNDLKFDIQYFGDLTKLKKADFKTALDISFKYLPETKDGISFEYSNYYALDDGSYDIYYEQVYKDIRILDGYILMNIKGDKLISLKKKMVSVSEIENEFQELIPYSLALYRLYGAIDKKDLPIKFTEVNIVQELKKVNDENGLVSGETFSYYRFSSENKGRYQIKALEVGDN